MDRSQHFTFECYPDSTPIAVICDYLYEKKISALVSPLHDSDKKKDGELKKPHYHIIVSYHSLKSLSQAKKDFGGLAANGHIEFVLDLRNLVRYTKHLDNPEKFQYTDDPTPFFGFNYLKHFADEEPEDNFATLLNICRERHYKSFRQLVDYLLYNNLSYLIPFLSKNSYFFNQYLRSDLPDKGTTGKTTF